MTVAMKVRLMSADTPLIDAPAIDKATLRQLMQPSLFQWSIRVAGDWLLIVGPMLLAGYTRHWAGYVFAVLMAGIGQHRLAMMAHEGTHRQISRNKRFNDFLTGMFCMWPFGNPVGGWRRYHFTHHRYTNTDGDSGAVAESEKFAGLGSAGHAVDHPQSSWGTCACST